MWYTDWGQAKKNLTSDNVSSGPRNRTNPNGMVTALFLFMAAFTLGQALQINNGFLSGPGIALVAISLVCAFIAVHSQRGTFAPISQELFYTLLIIGLIFQLIELLTSPAGIPFTQNSLLNIWIFRFSLAIGGTSALVSLTPVVWLHIWLRRVSIAVVFFSILVAGVWMIRTSPDPFIDVFVFQQSSSQALLEGTNPYELTAPLIYNNSRLYGPELVNGDKLTIGNPYPPMSIYLSFLGYVLAGDIRYSCLAAILITGLLIFLVRPSRFTLLAAYLFMFTPRIFFVLQQSWTEPLVLFLAVTVIYCAIHYPKFKYIALGLLIASKQYLLLLFPLVILLIPPRSCRRTWVAAMTWPVVVAFTITAPLAFWNFPAFLWNVGLAQFYQPFRMDALSFNVLYAIITGQQPTGLLPFILLGLVFLFIWRYSQRNPFGYATALGLCLVVFFAFNKQAFCNYYFLVVGILCCALATATVSSDGLESAL